MTRARARVQVRQWLASFELVPGVKVVCPPPPSRTNWTRLVPPPVQTGHVSSLRRRAASFELVPGVKVVWTGTDGTSLSRELDGEGALPA